MTSASSKPSGYLLNDTKYYLEDALLLGGNEEIPLPDKSANVTGRMGDGYAIITQLISIPDPTELPNPPPIPSLLDFSFITTENEVKDANRIFVFNEKGIYIARIRSGMHQFRANGAFCGQLVQAEYTFKRNKIMNISIDFGVKIHINDDLFINAPFSARSFDLFIHPYARPILTYNMSDYKCNVSSTGSAWITFIPSTLCRCTQKPRMTSYTLPFIFMFLVL